MICGGDGEQLILDLLERLDNPDTVPGVTWADADGAVVTNSGRPMEKDLDQWPIPEWLGSISLQSMINETDVPLGFRARGS